MTTGTNNIGGVEFSITDLESAVGQLRDDCLGAPVDATTIAFVNAHSVELTHRNEDIRKGLKRTDIVTADGAGIILASWILGRRLPERVCGPDIFDRLCERLNSEGTGKRMFFLGSTEENLEKLEQKFGERYPDLVFAGSYSPPFKDTFDENDLQLMAKHVNASGADVLWIGLGAPKQEILAQQLKPLVNVKVIAPIGGVFDFFTGRVKLPPMWAQKMGLIWLYRFCQQPRRLFRRTMDLPVFFCRVLLQRIRELFSQ